MKHPIIDKALVSIDFPDKFYSGSFGRHATFDLKVDEIGLHLTLESGGAQKRRVGIHLHHYLLGEIVEAMAAELAAARDLPVDRRQEIREAALVLAEAAAPVEAEAGAAKRRPPGGRRASHRDR